MRNAERAAIVVPQLTTKGHSRDRINEEVERLKTMLAVRLSGALGTEELGTAQSDELASVPLTSNYDVE